MDLSQLFSGEHWFDPNPGAPSLAYSALAFVFAAVLGASVYFYLNKGQLSKDNKVMARLTGQMVAIGMAIGAIGLILIISRYLSIPYLSARVLVYLTIIALVGFVAYYAYYFVRVLPSRLVAYRVEAARRKYLPKPAVPSSRSGKKKARRRR